MLNTTCIFLNMRYKYLTYLSCLDHCCSPALLGRLGWNGPELLLREYRNGPLSQSCDNQRESERECKILKHPKHSTVGGQNVLCRIKHFLQGL